MKRTLLIFSLFLSTAFALFAQEPNKYSLEPCGTAPYTDPWLAEYLANPNTRTFSRTDDTLYVGMQVHLVARDNGSGRFTPSRLLDAFCTLNNDYAPSGVQFFFKYDWNLINNTSYFDHDDILTGIDMMYENDVEDALNIYFCSNPAGNCGYNVPYASIAMGNGCSGPADHTWAHEIGHAFTLQHTFLGWEGVFYNFSVPTPDTLLYDYTHFHAEPDTIVPAPLDTALTEYNDFSNCYQAADKFCDTPPDYLAYRWDCDVNNMSFVKQKDPDGNEFYSDGTFFMSYADDVCSNRFSDEQIQALRANILAVKQDWLSDTPGGNPVDGVANLASPIAGASAPSSNVSFHWNSVQDATHYLLQASRFSTFSIIELDVVASDTFYVGGNFSPNKTYYWRVRPFNNTYTCTDFGEKESFKTDLASHVSSADASGFRYYPSLIRRGIPLTLELPEAWINQEVQMACYDLTGRQVWTGTSNFVQQTERLNLPDALQEPGVYRLVLRTQKESKTISLVLN